MVAVMEENPRVDEKPGHESRRWLSVLVPRNCASSRGKLIDLGTNWLRLTNTYRPAQIRHLYSQRAKLKPRDLRRPS